VDEFHKKHNFLYENYDAIGKFSRARRKLFARRWPSPRLLHDASDGSANSRTKVLGELTKKAGNTDVQVMIEARATSRWIRSSCR